MQPGMPDMQNLMMQAQRMQQQMLEAQQQLADSEVTGTAGGGLVSATCSGTGELLALQIDPSVVDADDLETLQDLIVAAVRDGKHAADDLAQQAMGPLAGGLGGMGLPGLPGM